MNNSGIKTKIAIINFLQFAAWGAWLITIGTYIGSKLSTESNATAHISSIYALQGIASLIMPTLMGIVADRWLQAQKVFGLCHFLTAIFLTAASFMPSFSLFYPMMMAAVMFYMPTIALNNTVAYNALYTVDLDPVKHFPPLRVWGTVGFILSMWTVDLLGCNTEQSQLWIAAGLSVAAGCAAFAMPACHIKPLKKDQSFVERFGLKAFTLFKQKKMAVFFCFSMLLGFALQITNMFADGYIQGFGDPENNALYNPAYKDTFGVQHSTILISLSQISEALCILLIPFCLKKFGIKKVMLISMTAWVLRFGLLGAGNPGPGVWMFVLSMIVYGVAFDFFNISGALFVEQEVDSSMSASAQGVFMMMTNGFGAFFGSYIAGAVQSHFGWPDSWFIFAGYALVITVLFAILFKNPQRKNYHRASEGAKA